MNTASPQNTAWRVLARVAVALALIVGASCAAPKKTEKPAWTPPPRVTWAEVSFVTVPPVENGYKILIPQPTRGVFPACMAVTRVAVSAATDEIPEGGPRLYVDPKNEFLQWNRTVDDQMAVSEVFPIAHRDLGGGEATPVQILAAFRALDARLGLIYAVNELSPTQTEMFGTLFDTLTAQPVAALHARAESMLTPEQLKKKTKPVDLFKVDSRALVRARFDDLVHECIRDLILHDERERTDVPEGWTRPAPTRPAEWPPREFRNDG